MKDILIDGHRLLTTNEIADAVIDYARLLHSTSKTDVVEFPTLHDGELSHCSLLLSAHVGVAVLDADAVLAPLMPGAEMACAEIERRAATLR
ncbi:MAG: hypothetical protein P0Y48_09525 [Candidatus Microbacterium phytovorans]|uniref:Uncharacterized protein n=1 Tax=Candidatus Microbacterium phytovorans TaxID=3121374 RepID=A0AAJ6B360_9MICO|nr:hypothetical protein [Microbacterium sp.]WEK12709.1 MAG: hypothetical protein P0Y48_09525 [Microbacterium sp.]